jgi:hypothetical protein
MMHAIVEELEFKAAQLGFGSISTSPRTDPLELKSTPVSS